jgi:hypothetical protein
MLYLERISESNPKSFAFALIYSKAIVADSFITVPKFPVMVIVPSGDSNDSMNKNITTNRSPSQTCNYSSNIIVLVFISL